MCTRKQRCGEVKKANSIKAIALTICDLHTQTDQGGEMCEMEVKQFSICRRLISQIDFDDFSSPLLHSAFEAVK